MRNGPPSPATLSRLLVLERRTGRVQHRRFSDGAFLNPGDVLVVNDTIPARFFCRRQTVGLIEGLFCTGRCRLEVLLKPPPACTGERLKWVAVELVLIERARAGSGSSGPNPQWLELLRASVRRPAAVHPPRLCRPNRYA